MKRLLELFLVLSLLQPVFSQAVPKVSPAPAHHQQQNKSTAAPVSATGACAPDYYRNVDGICVHRPIRTKNSAVPAGATAQCRDGSYAFSQHRRGTCSHHGGVAKWL